ncbi:hypothetical protein niasHT_016834 [Heterodera trifolii]|uniref:Innexin n=1 Tax=Heterodera trifolii TaxID=157864 RepID=A0ABD2KT59_9BILA
MQPVIDAVIKILIPVRVQLDDFVDRLCYRYTPMLLALFMFITGTVDYIGKPINCMVPNEFSEAWVEFVHQYCYVTGTYVKYYHFNGENDQSTKIYVHYYQWVPFVIIVQALLIRIPFFLWRLGQRIPDVDFNHVNELCWESRLLSGEKREQKLTEAAEYIFGTSKSRGNGLGCCACFMYLLFKLMNIFVNGAQLFFLTHFVGYKNWRWGITLIESIWRNNGWQEEFTYFPRISYCEFGRDFLGHTDGGLLSEVRCVLSVNMINEKVFLFLYFWYLALIFLTVFNSFLFIARLMRPFQLYSAKSFLKLVPTEIEGWNVRQFEDELLGLDGLLLMRFVRQNSGPLVACELGARLYENLQKTDNKNDIELDVE